MMEGNEDVVRPFENRNGVATSSSPWERAWEGNEDVGAPADTGAGSGCVPSAVQGNFRSCAAEGGGVCLHSDVSGAKPAGVVGGGWSVAVEAVLPRGMEGLTGGGFGDG